MGEFEGKVALITGAGRGIGRGIAIAFGQVGALVAANDVAPDGLERTVEEIVGAGGTAKSFVADVSKKMQVQSMIEAVREDFGRIDILVNNAGVEPRGALLVFDEWDWDRTMAVNLKGPFLLTQSVGRVMADEGGGSIVNIGTSAGRAHGLQERAAYLASKMGLLGLTRESARELAPYGIRVNAVCPGVVDTELAAERREDQGVAQRGQRDIPLGRVASPADIGGAVLFLCSGRAGYLTGQSINVDGGQVMC